MAAKPLTSETIAITEKKMDMTLDDIIKMSKSSTTKAKQQRVSNRNQRFLNNAPQEKSNKMQRFMDSRSSLRQGFLAQRRSSFQRNQFPLATEAARRAAVAPLRNRAFNQKRAVNVYKSRVGAPPVRRNAANGGFAAKQQVKVAPKQQPQTLDSRFADMKEQRMMRFLSQQQQQQQQSNSNNYNNSNGGRQKWQRPLPPWGRGWFGN